jgi:hypothetical protein
VKDISISPEIDEMNTRASPRAVLGLFVVISTIADK